MTKYSEILELWKFLDIDLFSHYSRSFRFIVRILDLQKPFFI